MTDMVDLFNENNSLMPELLYEEVTEVAEAISEKVHSESFGSFTGLNDVDIENTTLINEDDRKYYDSVLNENNENSSYFNYDNSEEKFSVVKNGFENANSTENAYYSESSSFSSVYDNNESSSFSSIYDNDEINSFSSVYDNNEISSLNNVYDNNESSSFSSVYDSYENSSLNNIYENHEGSSLNNVYDNNESSFGSTYDNSENSAFYSEDNRLFSTAWEKNDSFYENIYENGKIENSRTNIANQNYEEKKISVTVNNNVSVTKECDIDDVIEKLSMKIAEAVEAAGEGIHI